MSLTKPISFGILAFPYQTIDVAGPIDILSACSSQLIAGGEAAHVPEYDGLTAKSINITFHHIGIDLSPVLLTANMSIIPTTTLSTCPELDYLLVGGPDTFTYSLPAAFGDFIKAHLAAGKGLFTNCTGAMAIAPFGVLNGKRATVNHGILEYAMKLFPDVKWEKKQWVEDGSIWTAGGACAGMDMFAHWVVQNYDKDVAKMGFAGLDFEPRDQEGKRILKAETV